MPRVLILLVLIVAIAFIARPRRNFHGLIPGSRAWPFIWPALAGALAFWQVSGAPGGRRLRHGLAGAFTAGAAAAAISFIGATITVMVGQRALQSVPTSGGRALISAAAELGILAACAVVIVARHCLEG